MEMRNMNESDLKEEVYQLKTPEKVSFWDGVKKHLKSYCEISSIQGLNYMVKDGVSWFERFWWILIFFLCVGGCTYMVYELVDKWITTPVLVSLATKETSIHEIPFPAVTICPETKISTQCLNYTKTLNKRKQGRILEVALEENMYFDYMSMLCKSENHGSSTELYKKAAEEYNTSIPFFDDKLLKKLFELDDYAEFLYNCKSVTLENSYCEWMGESVNCKDILTPILTDEGLCYSFNMLDVRDIYSDINQMKYYNESKRNPDWRPDDGYPEGKIENVYPRRSLLSGAKYSLVVALLTKESDIIHHCRNFGLQGVRVSLDMPARIPRPSQIFFSVGLDRLATVAVTPSLMSTTEDVKEYDPHKRNCYFGNERKLKYFKLYSQSNCNLECWTNFTIQQCGCTHFYMPRDEHADICNLTKRVCLEEARVTYPKSLFGEKVRKKSSMEASGSKCDCLPLCTDLNYNSEISNSNWEFNEDIEGAEDYKGYRASAVKVFFKNGYFLPTEKSELYNVVDFISDAGGILGLFTGFSLFSLAEIIYYLSVKVIENNRQYGYWAGERIENVNT